MFSMAFITRFLGPVAFAFGQLAQAASNEPYVHGVVVDAEQAVITLYGTSLAGRTYMKLGLNGHSQLLEVIDIQEGRIQARLPRDIQAGSYLLRIFGMKPERVEEIAFTIGAVGPALDEKH